MPDPSAALDAAVRAVRGESDRDTVMPALTDERLARVIACAPVTHPVVRAVAALCGGLTGLLDAPTVADPALHAALVRLIGTPEGRTALWWWARVAPAGWGAAHAAALTDAVQRRRCDPGVAAALIGPCDDAAVLLHTASEAAFAIRRWGQTNHAAAPTAWAEALSPAERDRLITALRRDPFQVASCLPWLPSDVAHRMRLDENVIDAALDAFACASPTARTRHAARLRRLVVRALPAGLGALTRLACATQSREVWRRVQTLVLKFPVSAQSVVAAAPWDDLADDVRAAILERADRSPVCAAVAAARGRRDAATADITEWTAVAFFAALDPDVWDALDVATQRRWRHALSGDVAHLAVRSLGLRPEFLARAPLNNLLAIAAQRHARDATALCAALLPVALRACDPAAAHALIAALPPPPDPGAFFIIAGGRDDPDLIAPARSALRTPADLACAVALQRCGDIFVSFHDRSAAIRHALRGRSWDDLTPIMPLLDARVRAELMPDADALVARLAHPDRRDAFRQTLARLASLPPEVAIPTFVALNLWKPWHTPGTAAALADALHAHGDVFLALTDALHDDLRDVGLPPQDDSSLARALRALAQEAPSTALDMARALHARRGFDAIQALLTAPPRHAVAVWGALDDDVRRVIGATIATVAPDVTPLVERNPMAGLALAALVWDDAVPTTSGSVAPERRAAILRALWTTLPPAAQRDLGLHPAVADLLAAAAGSPDPPAACRRVRRGRA